MANWSDVLSELNRRVQEHQKGAVTALDAMRREYLAALANYTKRNTIAYYSAFLSKPRIEGVEIVDDDKNALMNCVHGLDRSRGLDLILHTPGASPN